MYRHRKDPAIKREVAPHGGEVLPHDMVPQPGHPSLSLMANAPGSEDELGYGYNS